jgi:3-methyladenine DNA glycosylase AlkD
MSVDTFYLEHLSELFHTNKYRKNALDMSKYMKGHFHFFGIKSPLRQKIMREWWQGESIKKEYDLKSLISALWKLDEREFQYVALDFGKRFKRLFTPESIPFIRKCVTTKSWCDTVDTVASHFTGVVIYQYPKTGKVMDKWIDDENMWIRRTAILHQLNFKERTNEDRLFCYCEKRMHESEFFIRKAIGWALRQYSYVDGNAVLQFVKDNKSELSTLSKTEALKALKRKVKI